MLKRVIWKYEVAVGVSGSPAIVVMPAGAKILSVSKQPGQRNGIFSLWAIVDPLNNKCEREIIIRGTGHEFDALDLEPFIGTVIDGDLVWHIYAERM